MAISIMSSMAPTDKQLTGREQQFLTECCVLAYQGVDVNDFSKLRDHFLAQGIHPRVTDVSQYKNRVATKGWIKSAHKKLVLPSDLIANNEGSYTIGFTFALPPYSAASGSDDQEG